MTRPVIFARSACSPAMQAAVSASTPSQALMMLAVPFVVDAVTVSVPSDA